NSGWSVDPPHRRRSELLPAANDALRPHLEHTVLGPKAGHGTALILAGVDEVAVARVQLPNLSPILGRQPSTLSGAEPGFDGHGKRDRQGEDADHGCYPTRPHNALLAAPVPEGRGL